MPKGRMAIIYIHTGYRNMKHDPFDIQELHEWIEAEGSFCNDNPIGYGVGRIHSIERDPVMLRPDGYTLDRYMESREVICPDCRRHREYVFCAYDTSSAWYQETRFDYAKEH